LLSVQPAKFLFQVLVSCSAFAEEEFAQVIRPFVPSQIPGECRIMVDVVGVRPRIRGWSPVDDGGGVRVGAFRWWAPR
jgi:hypothetical protein